MSLVIAIRKARPGDENAIASICEASWREAYQGLIPGLVLERILSRRSLNWSRAALCKGRPIAVVDMGKKLAGYSVYGPRRSAFYGASGEIDELYLAPECQGIGLGRRLFKAISNDLHEAGLAPFVVWTLAENERACGFYESMGGRYSGEINEKCGGVSLRKAAYVFE